MCSFSVRQRLHRLDSLLYDCALLAINWSIYIYIVKVQFMVRVMDLINTFNQFSTIIIDIVDIIMCIYPVTFTHLSISSSSSTLFFQPRRNAVCVWGGGDGGGGWGWTGGTLEPNSDSEPKTFYIKTSREILLNSCNEYPIVH